jgi:ribokinase
MVVGSVTIDLTAFSERTPAPGETILGDSFFSVLGGKGANQAISAALAGGLVHLVACVGSDVFSDVVMSSLAEYGVNTDFVTRVDGPTGVAHIRVDGSAQNSIVIVPLANSLLTTDHIDCAFDGISQPTVLLTQLEVRAEVAQYAITKAHHAGVTVILDPAPARALDDAIWKCVDIVTPNETEAFVLTGIDVVDESSALRAGRWFTERGVRWALITLAGDGALLVWTDGYRHFEPLEVEAIDTTAAGDAFAGYLAAQLAQGLPLADAIDHAVVAGGIAVTRRGASPSLPTKNDVDARLRERALYIGTSGTPRW